MNFISGKKVHLMMTTMLHYLFNYIKLIIYWKGKSLKFKYKKRYWENNTLATALLTTSFKYQNFNWYPFPFYILWLGFFYTWMFFLFANINLTVNAIRINHDCRNSCHSWLLVIINCVVCGIY